MQLPIESLNLQLLNAGLARHNGDWNWKGVCSPFIRIYYVTEGRARLHLRDCVVEMRPCMLYIVPAYTIHSYECRGAFVHYYLHVYEGYKSATNMFDLYDFPTEVTSHEQDHLLFANICHMLPNATLPASDPTTYDNTNSLASYVRRYNEMPLFQKMQVRSSLLMLFSRFVEKAVPKPWTQDDRLMKVLTYINNNLYDDIDIDTLADVACMSKSYFIRYFKSGFSTSPLQFINRKKMECAQLMLITEAMSVKEVAYAIGFNNENYFTRLFRKLTGHTPKEYRAMHAL